MDYASRVARRGYSFPCRVHLPAAPGVECRRAFASRPLCSVVVGEAHPDEPPSAAADRLQSKEASMSLSRIMTAGAAALAVCGALGMAPAAAKSSPASVPTWTQQAPGASPSARD